MAKQPYINIPPSIRPPKQELLFTTTHESSDCFISGTPTKLDSETVYTPWTAEKGSFSRTPTPSLLAIQHTAELHLNYMD